MKAISVIISLCSVNFYSISIAQNPSLISSLRLKFVEIPSGNFVMGSTYHAFEADSIDEKWFRDEAPVHRVSITEKFELSCFEITRTQFELFVNATNYITEAEKSGSGSLGLYNPQKGEWVEDSMITWKNPGYRARPDDPITHVTWKDARAFCNWLNSMDTTYYYSLPTEAEWEYAAGYADKRQLYSWGNELPNDTNGGNIADVSFSDRFPNWKYPVYKNFNDKYPLLAPVGSFKPNKLGLYDMTGNVWEWVDDYYNSYSTKPQTNPANISGDLNGKISCQQLNSNEFIRTKVIRGGGFDWELSYLRITKRRRLPIDRRYSSPYNGPSYLSAINVGFRIKRNNKIHKNESDFIRGSLQPQLNIVHFGNLPFYKIPWANYHSLARIQIDQILRVPNTLYYFVFLSGLGGDDYPYGQLYLVEMPTHPLGVIGYTILKEDFYLDLRLELTESLNSVRAVGRESASPYTTKEFDQIYFPKDYRYVMIFK